MKKTTRMIKPNTKHELVRVNQEMKPNIDTYLISYPWNDSFVTQYMDDMCNCSGSILRLFSRQVKCYMATKAAGARTIL